jgi:hypothetical protein
MKELVDLEDLSNYLLAQDYFNAQFRKESGISLAF